MKVETYILGLLIKYGSQHGYNLRQLVISDISDFKNIKEPTIYYHLEKLESKAYVQSRLEQSANNSEKKVFSISSSGEEYFFKNIYKIWDESYQVEFLVDGAFYFFDYFKSDDFIDKTKIYLKKIKNDYEKKKQKKEHVLSFLDKEKGKMIDMIYIHHILHYEAEIKWLEFVLDTLKK